MAKRIVVQESLICDLGTDGEHPAVSTVTVGLSGHWYELDLCDDHAREVDSAVEPIIRRAARKKGQRGKIVRKGASTPVKADATQIKAIRAWAKSKGIDVPARGRIPNLVLERYAEEAGRSRS